MKYESPPAKDNLLSERTCKYQPLRLLEEPSNESQRLCACSPELLTELCRCASFRNPWVRHSLPRLSCPSRDSDVVAYIRTDTESPSADEQIELIHSYCLMHGCRIKKIFEDAGRPSAGLTQALESLKEAQGLIAMDLNRFVEHTEDKLRDLRPFIHHFFCHTNKHLITIAEGIDTGTPSGQVSAVDIVNSLYTWH